LIRDYVERSQPAVSAHLREVARQLEREGASVREVDFPGDLDLALASHQVIQVVEAAELHGPMHAERPDAYLPRLRSVIEVGQLVPGFAYLRAQRWRRRFGLGLEGLLGELDALLLPTASNVAPDLSTTGDTSFQAVITMLGLPAISLPSGRDADGLPFATQLVGRAWDEAGLLSAASWCEQVFEPLPAPC
jgi:Asp-tRNA(Asn)/Glu-tRNA(Gln) amidotransferase A subunit family amidase